MLELFFLCVKEMHSCKQTQLVWSGLKRTFSHAFLCFSFCCGKTVDMALTHASMLAYKLKRADMQSMFSKKSFSETMQVMRESTDKKAQYFREHVASPFYCPKLISLVLHVLHTMHNQSKVNFS